MSSYIDVVKAVASNKISALDELLTLTDKAFESLKYADTGAYNEIMAELEDMRRRIDEERKLARLVKRRCISGRLHKAAEKH